jgi:hypothetical protein
VLPKIFNESKLPRTTKRAQFPLSVVIATVKSDRQPTLEREYPTDRHGVQSVSAALAISNAKWSTSNMKQHPSFSDVGTKPVVETAAKYLIAPL